MDNYFLLAVFMSGLTFLSFGTAVAAQRSVTVDCTTRSSSDSSSLSFTSMAGARDYVRTLQPLNDSVLVQVKGDCSLENASLALDPLLDSGTDDYTITYTGAIAGHPPTHNDPDSPSAPRPARKTARLLGGKKLPVSGFVPAPQVGPNVVEFNLTSIGFSCHKDLGYFWANQAETLGVCRQSRAEIFFNDEPMLLARYPNAPVGGGPWYDWLYANTSSSPESGGGGGQGEDDLSDQSKKAAMGAETRAEQERYQDLLRDQRDRRGSRNGVLRSEREARPPWAPPTVQFSVNTSRAARWASAVNRQAAAPCTTGLTNCPDGKGKNAVQLHGYWHIDWQDAMVPLVGVNSTHEDGLYNLTIQTEQYKFDQAAWSVYVESRFYVVNLLEELDAPGEYFIDDETNMLYFYPPTPITETSEVVISMNSAKSQATSAESPGIISAQDDHNPLHDVVFESLAVMFSKGDGIVLPVTNRVSFKDMTVSSVGRQAVYLPGANNTHIDNLVSTGAGCGVVTIRGGWWSTLAKANSTVTNSHLTRYARWTRTYNPAIAFAGVGITYTGNVFGNAPHGGMTGDEVLAQHPIGFSLGTGGPYMHVEGNYFFNLCYEVRDTGAFYIYGSWVFRGLIVKSNYFVNITSLERTVRGFPHVVAVYLDDDFAGAHVENNTMINADIVLLANGGRDTNIINNRAERTGFRFSWFNPVGPDVKQKEAQLLVVNYTAPPYSVAFPKLPNTLNDHPDVPARCVIVGNTYCKTIWGSPPGSDWWESRWYSVFVDNTNFTQC